MSFVNVVFFLNEIYLDFTISFRTNYWSICEYFNSHLSKDNESLFNVFKLK